MTGKAANKHRLHWLQILLLSIFLPVLAFLVFAGWYISDANRLKPEIERAVSVLTGRNLVINGDLDYTVGMIFTVHATNIDWLNPPWSGNPKMLHVDEIEISVDLSSFRRDLIEITHAKASGVELVFEWFDAQPMNWDMRDPTAPASTTPLEPIPLALLDAEINDAKLRFIHPAL